MTTDKLRKVGQNQIERAIVCLENNLAGPKKLGFRTEGFRTEEVTTGKIFVIIHQQHEDTLQRLKVARVCK